MSYKYREHAPKVLTPVGQRELMRLCLAADAALSEWGAVKAGRLLALVQGMDDSWSAMAVVDAWLELSGDRVFEVHQSNRCAWQDRIFSARS